MSEIIEGYKVGGYDATYKKTLFSISERGIENGVLEVTDIEAGVTFIVPLDDNRKAREIIYEQQVKKYGKARTRTGTWKQKQRAENNDRRTEQQGFEQGVCSKVITVSGSSRDRKPVLHAKRND